MAPLANQDVRVERASRSAHVNVPLQVLVLRGKPDCQPRRRGVYLPLELPDEFLEGVGVVVRGPRVDGHHLESHVTAAIDNFGSRGDPVPVLLLPKSPHPRLLLVGQNLHRDGVRRIRPGRRCEHPGRENQRNRGEHPADGFHLWSEGSKRCNLVRSPGFSRPFSASRRNYENDGRCLTDDSRT